MQHAPILIDVREAVGEKTGKGWYTAHIVSAILKIDQKTPFILFTHKHVPLFEKYKNVEERIVHGRGIIWHLRVRQQIVRLAKKFPHLTFFAPTSFIVPAFLPKKIRTVITVHDLVAFLFPNHHNKKATIIERVFLPFALRKVKAIITVSQSTKRDLLKFFPKTKAPIHVIYNAADQPVPVSDETRAAVRQKFHLPEKIILDIGTLEPRKNHVRVLKAFAAIADKHSQHHLVIAGGKGWQYENVFKTHAAIIEAQPHLKKHIHFLGYVTQEELQTLYTLADLFVFPARYEGFGLPALEALTHGCPVIVPNNSSLPEVVGDAAMLVDPYSEEEIAQAMERILINPEFAEELRVKGIVQARKFSWEKAGRETVTTLNNLGSFKTQETEAAQNE